MDPEQTYLRVHARLSGVLSQLLTPVIRMALELMYFTFAIAIFALLFVMHVNFVQQITTAGLWTQNSYEQNSLELQRGHFKGNTGGPDIATDGFTVLSTKFWSNWLGLGSRRNKLIFKSWKNDKELLVPVVGKTSDTIIIKTMEHETDSKIESPICQVGYPTSISEFIKQVEAKDFSSYLYNYQTKEFYDLSYGQRASHGPTRFGEYLVTKCGVLIMSLFVFFTTTMSVSFTLRETQSRMLRFTVQLQHHARNHLPTFQLIFVHVIESLVFVPIMIGILFFLFEFYDDQLLAILVLTLVWLCELFTMISVRTTISMQFFPRFFLLYFLVFHIYFFSYPYGFSYVAFSAMAAFMQHLILYFWNQFEVTALQRFMRTRAQLQQQTGVQIASSAIYTSTFHIARVSISNRNALGNEPTTAATEISAMSDQTGESNTPFANNEPPEVLNINPHQRILQRPTISLGSLLLSLLGGASSESIFSFFSVSRDSQNQGQAHQEQTPQENQPLTT